MGNGQWAAHPGCRSLGGRRGITHEAAYCASKAAVTMFMDSLRQDLNGTGVHAMTLCPGFVRTPMSDRFLAPKPWLMTPERAALLIRRGLARNRARIAFPGVLAWTMWCLSILPAALSQWMVRTAGYGR